MEVLKLLHNVLAKLLLLKWMNFFILWQYTI